MSAALIVVVASVTVYASSGAGHHRHALSKKLVTPASVGVAATHQPNTPAPIASGSPSTISSPQQAKGATPLAQIRRPTMIPVKPMGSLSYPTSPFTCYTYNWTDNWWIAYRYDVTPSPDGNSQAVIYGGGSGHANTPPPSTFPDMCAYNTPPTSKPAPSPVPPSAYPDTSPH